MNLDCISFSFHSFFFFFFSRALFSLSDKVTATQHFSDNCCFRSELGREALLERQADMGKHLKQSLEHMLHNHRVPKFQMFPLSLDFSDQCIQL